MLPIGIAAVLTTFAWAAPLPAQEVSVRVSGDQLQVAAPNLHFLTGKPLQRLRNGAAVRFDIQVSLLADSRLSVLRRSFERFIISYDLWEEKFSVTRMRSSRATVSHLTAPAAEAWCLNNISIHTAGLPQDRPFHVRVDIRAQNGRDDTSMREEDENLSLATLIDLFSRSARQHGDTQWRAESGLVRLADLRRTEGR
jgi:hypothetical protein